MGNLARAAVIIAKINGLVLILGLVLGLVTVLLAVLSVKVDKQVVTLHLWPTDTVGHTNSTPIILEERAEREGRGISLEEAAEWGILPKRKRQRQPTA